MIVPYDVHVLIIEKQENLVLWTEH